MVIKRSDPFREIANIQSEVARLFDQIYGFDSEEIIVSEGDLKPPIDIYENKNQLVLVIECPGISVKDIEISTTGNSLLIMGKKREEIEEREKSKFICMERSFGIFKRLIRLPFPIDSKDISAIYKDGILTIKLSKIKEKRGVIKKIPIIIDDDS